MPNILLIDDDELSREIVTLMLAAEGHAVTAHASGEEALASLSNPEIILTDLHMPGFAGNPLAEQLRKSAPNAKLIAISARQPAVEAISGFDSFLLKPFTAEQLQQALIGQSETKPEPESADPVLDQTTIGRLNANMKPGQLRQLLQFAIDDARRRTTILEAAASNNDEPAFIREAHTLQGGCGMIGALQLRTIVRTIENQGLSAASRLKEIPPAIHRLERMLETLPE